MHLQIPEAFSELFNPAWRHQAYWGGRGGAKTRSFGAALIVQAAQQHHRVLCCREIQNSIDASVKQVLADAIDRMKLPGFKVLDTEIRGPNDSLFIFAGMRSNPDKIKSAEGITRVWVAEANRVSQRSIDLLIPTIRADDAQLWWEWNPETNTDPVDALFRGEFPPPNSHVRRVSWRDNPWFPKSLLEEKDRAYRADAGLASHIWDGEYRPAQEGAYFAAHLQEAREQGRIGRVSRDPTLPIRAFWDLGYDDRTAVWIGQFVGREIRVLDHFEGRQQPLGYYIAELRTRGWAAAEMVLPHDGANVTVIAQGSARQQLMGAGFAVKVVPNQGKGAAMLRVEAARKLFPSIWFNEDTTRDGLKRLGAYVERRDPKTGAGLGPLHDEASDSADAFGLMCVAYEEPRATARNWDWTPPATAWG